MASLKPFDQAWAGTVLASLTTAEESRHWCGRTDFPLSDPALFEEWHAQEDVRPFLLFGEDGPIGYGELWLDDTDTSAELARLLIFPQWRSQGFGRRLVEHLIEEGRSLGYNQFWVRVFPSNETAIACYRSCGFHRQSAEEEAALNQKQRHPFVWMTLKSDDKSDSLAGC